jgi:pimeloyl-ACP methyl ester carboxylesterase
MEKRLLSYKSSQISYYRFGNGPRIAICFHGYAENATTYKFLEKYTASQFTFYAIDLPFHGNTQWHDGLNFTHTDLQQIIHDILLENNTRLGADAPEPVARLTVIGFSLGGRIALSLYQAWPEIIERLVLIAPDGFKVNFWYWLATRTWAGNHLFHFTMKYPGWFFVFLRMLNKFGFVNASVFKFVNYYIGNKNARLELFQRWTSLRRLKPNLKRIKSCIRQHKTKVRLIYGQHDRIILPVRTEQFREGIESYCTFTLLDSGHQLLHEKHAAEIVERLTD